MKGAAARLSRGEFGAVSRLEAAGAGRPTELLVWEVSRKASDGYHSQQLQMHQARASPAWWKDCTWEQPLCWGYMRGSFDYDTSGPCLINAVQDLTVGNDGGGLGYQADTDKGEGKNNGPIAFVAGSS